MFQHPGTVQCAWVHAYLYARPLLFKETIFPYLIDQATCISLHESVVEYFQSNILTLGNICYWLERSYKCSDILGLSIFAD